MHLSVVRPSVPSGRRTPMLRVCCCGPGVQQISIDCCSAGAQRQSRRSNAARRPNASVKHQKMQTDLCGKISPVLLPVA